MQRQHCSYPGEQVLYWIEASCDSLRVCRAAGGGERSSHTGVQPQNGPETGRHAAHLWEGQS